MSGRLHICHGMLCCSEFYRVFNIFFCRICRATDKSLIRNRKILCQFQNLFYRLLRQHIGTQTLLVLYSVYSSSVTCYRIFNTRNGNNVLRQCIKRPSAGNTHMNSLCNRLTDCFFICL